MEPYQLLGEVREPLPMRPGDTQKVDIMATHPDPGNFYYGMLKGRLDKGSITVANVTRLIKFIDSCKDIVDEIAGAYMNI